MLPDSKDHRGDAILVKPIHDPDVKAGISRAIMGSLPQWFNPPDSIDGHAEAHKDYPYFAAYGYGGGCEGGCDGGCGGESGYDGEGGSPIGFIALKIHNPYTADVYHIGVLERLHRKGVGRRLMDAAKAYCLDGGYTYLTVKTLDASAAYEPYERTRAFYRGMGFIPLEVFTKFWNEGNPCLFMACRLRP